MLAPAYQLSTLDRSQAIADQTFEVSIFLSLASLEDALYRTAVATADLCGHRIRDVIEVLRTRPKVLLFTRPTLGFKTL